MPHAELKYSSDLTFDPIAVLQVIEATNLEHDSGAGECKGRAYSTDLFHHSHCLISVSMLRKPHWDAAVTARMLAALEAATLALLKEPCEPRRFCRRLPPMIRMEHYDKDHEQVFTRSARACSADGIGRRGAA